MIYIFNHGDSEAIMTRLLSSKTRVPIQSFPKKNVRKKKNENEIDNAIDIVLGNNRKQELINILNRL